MGGIEMHSVEGPDSRKIRDKGEAVTMQQERGS